MQSSSNSSAVNFSVLQNQKTVPAEFVWPENDVTPSQGNLDVPVIDLRGFFSGDAALKERTAAAVRAACEEYGVFQVINHDVDSGLTNSALETASWFFGLPMNVKMKAERTPGNIAGYSVAHAERFSANLLWNETVSFDFSESPTPVVEEFVRSKLGQDFDEMGKLYQRYCESMNRLSLDLMELIGISLDLKDQKYYRTFFEDSCAIFRCNYYPPCKQPDRALGTGPHRDPTAITILLQDGVSGLEVFSQGIWRTVHPYPGAFVINIGDLFVALSKEKYKSCLHRAVLNKDVVRKSLVYFVFPRKDKLIAPPEELLSGDSKKYPNFTWSEYQKFVVTKYRVDDSSLDKFSAWLAASSAENEVE